MLSAPVQDLSAPVQDLSAPVNEALVHQLPDNIQGMINKLGKRTNNKEEIEDIIYAICEYKTIKIPELSALLGKTEKYLLREYMSPMRESGKLAYTFPEMPNHPEQAYKAVNTGNKNQNQ